MINVIPKYIDVIYWAATVCDDYSNWSLPILKDKEQWAKWGRDLTSYEPFLEAQVPSPYKEDKNNLAKKAEEKNLAFGTWEEWAMMVYNIINSEPN